MLNRLKELAQRQSGITDKIQELQAMLEEAQTAEEEEQIRRQLKRLEEEQMTKGGIIIPDTAAEKPQTGKVVSAGPGARGDDGKLQPLGVKAGDKVLFGKWSGTEVKLDGDDLLIMKESDIMGILG